MKTLIPTALACALMLIPLRAEGQTADSGQQPEFSGVSTRYFGPYAFPVPDLLDGRIHDGLHVELSGDAVAGRAGGRENRDWTFAPTFRLSVPLWTDRASFTIWGEFHEFYFDTPATRAARNLAPGALPLKGNDSGNLYFGIEIQALKERRLVPSVAVRASTLSATGDDHEAARHYDAPGYFFDVSVGKSFPLGEKAGSIRLSGTAGFVCWQIGEGTQNDALLLGARLAWESRHAGLYVEYGQYKGRENDWAASYGIDSGDWPQSIKSRLDLHFGDFSPFIYVQYGFRDWPFTQFRLGLTWTFDLLGHFSAGSSR